MREKRYTNKETKKQEKLGVMGVGKRDRGLTDTEKQKHHLCYETTTQMVQNELFGVSFVMHLSNCRVTTASDPIRSDSYLQDINYDDQFKLHNKHIVIHARIMLTLILSAQQLHKVFYDEFAKVINIFS